MHKGFKPFQTITVLFFYSVRANKQIYNRTNTANKGGEDYIYLSVDYTLRVDFFITQINMTSASFFCFTF